MIDDMADRTMREIKRLARNHDSKDLSAELTIENIEKLLDSYKARQAPWDLPMPSVEKNQWSCTLNERINNLMKDISVKNFHRLYDQFPEPIPKPNESILDIKGLYKAPRKRKGKK